ncbi:hypothetical protein B0H11DRAFT_834748 [Mycena galericulata]|nr:hypothetical protein B0H11DRAFT_834748 [Mycena galericulata]
MEPSRCSHCGSEVPWSPTEQLLDLEIGPGTLCHTFLTSNNPPDEAESTLVRSVVSNITERLTCLDEEISGLREQLKQLEEERASVSLHHMQTKRILSPLRRMPPELLAEIFSWTSRAEPVSPNRGRFKQSPWVFTQISSRWRKICISTPSLWSLVYINYDKGSVYPLAAIECQIQRAQTLQIRFFPSREYDSGSQAEMFELLVKHSSRWEVLRLGVTQTMLPALTTLRHRVPSLRVLWMQWNDEENPAAVDSIDCFSTAPSLIHAGVYEPYRSVSIPMPVHQLTWFELDGSMEMHLGILKLAKNLVSASIFVSGNGVTSHETLHVPSLRRLYVSDLVILDYIRAPALEEIAVWVDENGGPDTQARLGSLIDRSASVLRRLCLSGWPDSLTTTAILLKYPSIVELVVVMNGSVDVSALMSTFTVSALPGSTSLAPHLRCILFSCDKATAIDYTQYFEMLKSRWNAPNNALKAATLARDEGPLPDPATRSQLDVLRRDGLDFSLLTGQEASHAIFGWNYHLLYAPPLAS